MTTVSLDLADPLQKANCEKMYDLINRVLERIDVEGWTPEQAEQVMGYSADWIRDIQQGNNSKFIKSLIK